MPVVFLIIFLISVAHTNSKNFSSFYKLILVIYLLTISIISTNLSIQHRELTAVAKLREYLISYKSDIKIFTNPLINYYLTSTGANVKFVNSDDTSMVKIKDLEDQEMIMIGDYHEKIDKAMNTGHILATEIADYLATKGVPFREAHEQVGALVQLAEEHHCQVDELSEDQLKSVASAIETDVVDRLSFKSAINQKNGIGGTAFDQVSERLVQLKEAFQW